MFVELYAIMQFLGWFWKTQNPAQLQTGPNLFFVAHCIVHHVDVSSSSSSSSNSTEQAISEGEGPPKVVPLEKANNKHTLKAQSDSASDQHLNE